MRIQNLAELDRVRNECKKMVSLRATASAGAAALPFPGADIATDIGLLMELIPTINRKFGLSPEQIDQLDPRSKQILMKIITAIGSQLAGKYISKTIIVQLLKKVSARVAVKSIAKFIPGLGTLIASSLSFGAMKILGDQHVDECYEIIKRTLDSLTEPRIS